MAMSGPVVLRDSAAAAPRAVRSATPRGRGTRPTPAARDRPRRARALQRGQRHGRWRPARATRRRPARSRGAACPRRRRGIARSAPSKVQVSGITVRAHWRWPLELARVAAGDLHRDFRGGIRAVVAGAMDAPDSGEPVALGEHADHLRPARIRGIGAIGGDVPLVGTQRTAGPRTRAFALVASAGRAALGRTAARARRARRRRWGRSACRSCPRSSRCRGRRLRVEHLLAGEPRGARAMRVRQPAQDHFGDRRA